MPLRLTVDDLTGPEIAEFLAGHIEEMKSVSPPESKHALDLEALRQPEVTFWSVLDGETLAGCGAVKYLGAGHAEVKSMRTAAAYQRRGVASTLLRHIIAESRRLNQSRLSLETGSAEFFAPARALYLRHGFAYCAPFADYTEDPHSVYLTREL